MKIPKRFHLMGHVYEVVIVPRSQWKDPEAVGLFDNNSRRILILKSDSASMQQVYLHEVSHAMLLAMGRDKLYRDESFVDLLASMLHQILTTSE